MDLNYILCHFCAIFGFKRCMLSHYFHGYQFFRRRKRKTLRRLLNVFKSAFDYQFVPNSILSPKKMAHEGTKHEGILLISGLCLFEDFGLRAFVRYP